MAAKKWATKNTAAKKAAAPAGKAPAAEKNVVKETKVEEVKATAAKPAEKKVEKTPKAVKETAAVPSVKIQSLLGGEISVEEVVSRVVNEAGTSDVEIYVKPEENKAYFSAKEKNGFVILWH